MQYILDLDVIEGFVFEKKGYYFYKQLTSDSFLQIHWKKTLSKSTMAQKT